MKQGVLKIPITQEYFDEEKMEFVDVSYGELLLEHSLVSLSKWESKWHKPFLSEDHEKTSEELLDYIKCMTLNEVDDSLYSMLNTDNIKEIRAYIENPMTATTITELGPKKFNKKIITSEVIYSWLVQLQIPFEVENWHLNRTITLVRVINAANEPKKKVSADEIAKRNDALNKARRAKFNSKG